MLDGAIQAVIDAYNGWGPVIILAIGTWLGVAVARHFLQTTKGKPKRQPLALGDDGELTEDWELVINPVEGVKENNS